MNLSLTSVYSILRRSVPGLILSLMLLNGCKDPGPELPTLLEYLEQDANFSHFLAAANMVEFDDDFDEFTLTLIVPTNAAFEQYFDQLGINAITELDSQSVRLLLRYHTQEGRAHTDNLEPGYFLTPCDAGPNREFVAILIQLVNGNFVFNGKAQIISANNEADNGYIHVIDQVLPVPTLRELLATNDNYSEMFEGMDRANLLGTLENDGPFTLMLPPNIAFTQSLEDIFEVDRVADLTDEQVNALMRYHILEEQHRFEDFSTDFISNYPTLLADSTMRVNTSSTAVVNDSVLFILTDVQTSNGVIHLVNEVLDPR